MKPTNDIGAIFNDGELYDNTNEYWKESDLCVNEEFFISTLMSEQYNGRDDTFFDVVIPYEDSVYLPVFSSYMIGSLFLIGNPDTPEQPKHHYNWHRSAKIKGSVCLIDVRSGTLESEILIGNSDFSEWIPKSQIQKFIDTYEAEYICNVFNHKNQYFEEYEPERSLIKQAYLMRVLMYYKESFENLHQEQLESDIEAGLYDPMEEDDCFTEDLP